MSVFEQATMDDAPVVVLWMDLSDPAHCQRLVPVLGAEAVKRLERHPDIRAIGLVMPAEFQERAERLAESRRKRAKFKVVPSRPAGTAT